MRRSWLFVVAMLVALFAPLEVSSAPQTGSEGAKSSKQVESFSDYMQAKLRELNLVGVGVGILRSDGSRWVQGFGLADMEQGIPVRPETVAMWASSSKVVTAAAALKIMREKGIAVDTPIAGYLPFKVVNPKFPDKPITFRHLLTHTSGILYDPRDNHSLYGSGDAAMSMEELLREYLVPGGRYYKSTNYSEAAPGEAWVYSNFNFSLLGYLVERISGVSFPEYCRTALFGPLEMVRATWRLRDLDGAPVALQYRSIQSEGKSRFIRHYGWPGYPDGGLRCSTDEMTTMMSAFLGAKGKNGRQVLDESILEGMFKPQHVDPAQLKGRNPITSLDMGLAWRLLEIDGRQIWSHNGNGSGMASLILLDDKTHTAAVTWITGGVLETPEGQAFFAELHRRLVEEMERR